MKTVEGYNAKIYTDNIKESASEQIKELLSIDVFSKCKIRIMPDVHAGAGCVIGFTGVLHHTKLTNTKLRQYQIMKIRRLMTNVVSDVKYMCVRWNVFIIRSVCTR